MSRYYGEEDLDYHKIERDPTAVNRTKAYMLLRPQFWRGQEYGSRAAIIHARHMRPICETVSTSEFSWLLAVVVEGEFANGDTLTFVLLRNNETRFFPEQYCSLRESRR